MVFQYNCGNSSSTLHQNCTSWQFLKVSCIVVSTIISMYFLYFASLKFIGLPFTLLDLLSMYNCVSSSLGHLENISSMSFANFPNANTFSLRKNQKSHLSSPPISSEKPKGIRKLIQAHGGTCLFSKDCLRFSFLIIGPQKYCQLFSLTLLGSFHLLAKKYLSRPHSLSAVLFSKRTSHEKMSSVCNTQGLLLKTIVAV